MLEPNVSVRSRLNVLLLERNTERARAGQAKLTIRQLAITSGVPTSVISGLTANRVQRVDFRTLDKLCKALDCTPGDILEFVPDA